MVVDIEDGRNLRYGHGRRRNAPPMRRWDAAAAGHSGQRCDLNVGSRCWWQGRDRGPDPSKKR